jgi:hypothetical protein
MAESVL